MGIRQAELARIVGVSQPTVSDWENLVTDPKTENLSILAVELKVNFEWLATGRGEMKYPSAAAEPGVTYEVHKGNGLAAIPPPVIVTNEDVLRYVLSLNFTVAEMAAAHSRALQILVASVVKQVDGSRLLLDIRNALERVQGEKNPNQTLMTLLNNLIAQIMRPSKD